MRASIVTILCIMLVAISLSPAQPGYAQVKLAATQVLNTDVDIPGSGGKYPDLYGFGDVAYLASNPGQKIAYWEKRDPSSAWPNPQILGNAGKQADFSTASVAVGPDGTVHVAWIDQGSNAMYLRRKGPGGTTFAGAQLIGERVDFPVYIDIAVMSNGVIFAVWNAADRMRYRFSTDGGNSWSGIGVVSDTKAAGIPSVSTGPNNSLMVAHYGDGKIYASRWNGNGFTRDEVAVSSGDNYFADPSGTIAPNGDMYVAWRSVNKGRVYYAERLTTDDKWRPPSNLASGGETSGVVIISADQKQNLHVFWLNNQAGGTDVYHAYKPSGQNWQPITLVNIGGGFNVDGAVTISDRIYAHAVYEVFTGGGLVTRYARVGLGNVGPPEGELVINEGAPVTSQQAVSARFAVTSGAANQYQLSNDNQVFTNFAALPDNKTVPWSLNPPTGTACELRTVYGYMRQDDRADLTSVLLSDQISLDPGVDVDVEARNPYLAKNAAVFSDGVLPQSTLRARDGDSGYTGVPYYYLHIAARPGECSGLKSYTVSDGQNSVTNLITGDVGTPILFPTTPPKQVNNLTITVRDNSDHERQFQQTIIYDMEAPVVVSGNLEVVDANDTPIEEVNSIFVTLYFSGVEVTDDLYRDSNGQQFWGLFLANSPEKINMQDQAALEALNWSPVPVPPDVIEVGTDGKAAFKVEWSLFGGLDDEEWQCNEDYQIIGAVVDGAGNVSVGKVADLVTVIGDCELPTVYLPNISK